MVKKVYDFGKEGNTMSYILLCDQIMDYPLFGWYSCGSTTIFFRYSYTERKIYLDFAEADSDDLSDKIIELRYDADEWPEIYGLIPQHPRKLSFSYKTAVEYIGMWKG
jgi:hypothetical protein